MNNMTRHNPQGFLTHGQMLKQYNQETRYKFNPFLFERRDADVVREISNVLKTLERDNQYYSIAITSIYTIDDYNECEKKLIQNEIDRIKSTTQKEKIIKEIKDRYSKINLKDTDFYLLVVNYFITLKQPDPVTGAPVQTENLEVLMKIPRYVDKYYFRIQGNLYCPIWQIVDGSTYNSQKNIPCVTFKVMHMAIRVYKMTSPKMKVSNPEGQLRLTVFNSQIFNKWIPIVKYLLARWGLYNTMLYLGYHPNILNVGWDPLDDDVFWNFKAHNMFVSVPKFLMDKDVILQSVVQAIVASIKRSDRPEDLMNLKYWVRSLGSDYSVDTVEKGEEILSSMNAVYDAATQDTLKLVDSHKEDIFQALAWIINEFDDLFKKDNMNLDFKRLRGPEYFGAIHAQKVNRSSYRISNGRGIDIDTIVKAIRTDANALIKEISTDKVVTYRNGCNDMDVWDALKFTFGGISGIGVSDDGETSSSVPLDMRTIHPSYNGRICQATSQASNPGMNGIIVPFADINNKGLFSEIPEPDTWREEKAQLMNDYYNSLHPIVNLDFEFGNWDTGVFEF